MKLKIKDMIEFYASKYAKTDGKPSTLPQIGYVMGGDGRIATDEYIKARAKSSYGDNWEAYYNAYRKWVGHAVLDCNAVAEYYYKLKTGVSIDTKAKYNYSGWCSRRSSKVADKKLTGLPQMPGVAVFSGNTSDIISHVGFLYQKYGTGDRDWYVLECRGKDYGLVLTTLKSRPWTFWGVMDKYFEYEEETEMKVLKLTNPLTKGNDVKSLQSALNALGYDCGTADGVCGKRTMAAIEKFASNQSVMDNSISVTATFNNATFKGTLTK